MDDKDKVSFQDLADSALFEEFFTITRDLTGLLIALVDPTGQKAKRLFPVEGENQLCLLIKSCQHGRDGCKRTDLENYHRAAKGKIALSYLCHAGMVDIAVPIFVDGCHIATINCGQVLIEPPSEDGFQSLLHRTRKYGLDYDALRQAYFNSPFIEPARLSVVLRLCSFFADYFCEMGRRLRVALPKGTLEVEKACRYIRSYFGTQLNLDDVAGHVGFAPSYFSGLFRRVTGMTFTVYVQTVRIEEAKRRLSTTHDRISDIAYEVGFSNQTHFNRVFTKLVKCSPSSYRKNLDDHGL